MPEFTYTARVSNGQPANGTVTAATINEAIQKIRAEGKYPISVRMGGRPQRDDAVPASITTIAPPASGVRISRADVIQFSTQLSMMIETGVTLSEALECIAMQSEKPEVQSLVGDVSERIQSGVSLSEALARHPRSFPLLYLALIRASEKSGMLSKLLIRATTYLRDEQETLRKIKGALTYPLIMLGFALTTTIFLLAFVLPRFTMIYATRNAALPVPTRILMAMSGFLVTNWPMLLTSVGSVVLAVAFYVRTPGGARAWHYIQLHTPLFGKLYKKVHLARGLRMVGTMAGAGVGLLDCVTVAHDLCDNTFFQDLWKRIGDQIQGGRQLSDPLFDSPLVPRSVAQMIFSGEKSGKVASVMEQVSIYSEQELKEQIASLTRYIEPAMIVVMGVIIGGICLALLLPIFTISKVMAQ